MTITLDPYPRPLPLTPVLATLVPLGLERDHAIAVVEGRGSPTEIFRTERDFSANKLKVTKAKPTEISNGLTKLINVPG